MLENVVFLVKKKKNLKHSATDVSEDPHPAEVSGWLEGGLPEGLWSFEQEPAGASAASPRSPTA